MRKSQFTEAQISFVLALERICHQVGYPQSIRVDQGSEFISMDLDLWAYQKGVVLDFSRLGKPTDNAFVECFKGKYRAKMRNGVETTKKFVPIAPSATSRRYRR